MPYLARVLIALVLGSLMTTSCLYAENVSPAISVGTQELGLSAGYLIPHLLKGKKSKTEQSGLVFMPSWMMTLTDPVGDSWYRGQISFGAEMAYIQFQEPVLTHGVGFTPKIKYTFVALDRIRPYAEFAGGPFWTDLGGKIPEQSSQFNFILSGGLGVSYFLNNQVALNAGYRFQHISNAHTSRANVGLNSSLPFIGFSFYF
ncbi:MAG: acyloxyacyl hydrolase [Nitrospira sp. CG24E]|nr:MAG: acyloxyacyl hydrolase [Nitrospira sp. CG24E]